MDDKFLSLLGICRRAGRLVIGADSSIDSIHKNKAKLIIFASDFSPNSSAPVIEAANKCNVRALTINRNKEELSLAVGKLCGVLTVEDNGFANKLNQLIESEQGGELYEKV